jgi:membrane-associated protein
MPFDLTHLHKLIDSKYLFELIQNSGYPLVWSFVFAESGILICAILPGDSLLFIAGFICSLPKVTGLNIWVMCFGCLVAAVLGNSFGYYTGKKWGRKLFDRPDSRIFKRKNLIAAEEFFDRQGKVAIIIARFIPFVRTFAPILAGMAAMRYTTFITYNVIGAIIWSLGLPLLGYFLGKSIPPDQIDKYLIPITVLIMFISLSPSIFHFVKERQRMKG